MNLDAAFPRYREHDPRVPVWCVTPGRGGCIHRFFDTDPISPSGRYLAVFRLPFEDRPPEPGDAGQVVLIDLRSGEARTVAESRGWEPQLGANLNWGADDHSLFFNDVDVSTWTPFAWKLDPLTGERTRLEGTVYHASPDGRLLVSANLALMRKTQSGYGVRLPDSACPPWRVGPAEDDGFYFTDTSTGRRRLFLSVAEIVRRAAPALRIDDAGRCEIQAFHAKFNRQGDRLMLSLRWFPAGDAPRWEMFRAAYEEVRYAWVTVALDGGDLHCAVGPEQWEKGGHHATWFPDGRRISMNLSVDGAGTDLRFVQVNADGTGLAKMHLALVGSGHPTVHRDGVHLLTDAYTREPVAFGDGTVPLRWIDLRTGVEETIVRIQTGNEPAARYPVLRCDPHPAWDRSWRYVTFNGFVGGTRRVFVADMRPLLS